MEKQLKMMDVILYLNKNCQEAGKIKVKLFVQLSETGIF